MGKVQIVRKNERKMVFFSALNEGDLFLDEGNEVCLKISPVYTASDDCLTAICVESGYQCYYTDDTLVIPIRAIMTIEPETV